jgi:hypothetical protein
MRIQGLQITRRFNSIISREHRSMQKKLPAKSTNNDKKVAEVKITHFEFLDFYFQSHFAGTSTSQDDWSNLFTYATVGNRVVKSPRSDSFKFRF